MKKQTFFFFDVLEHWFIMHCNSRGCNDINNCELSLVKTYLEFSINPLTFSSGDWQPKLEVTDLSVPPETSDREIFADLPVKERQKRENGAKNKANRKREGGKLKMERGLVTK